MDTLHSPIFDKKGLLEFLLNDLLKSINQSSGIEKEQLEKEYSTYNIIYKAALEDSFFFDVLDDALYEMTHAKKELAEATENLTNTKWVEGEKNGNKYRFSSFIMAVENFQQKVVTYTNICKEKGSDANDLYNKDIPALLNMKLS